MRPYTHIATGSLLIAAAILIDQHGEFSVASLAAVFALIGVGVCLAATGIWQIRSRIGAENAAWWEYRREQAKRQ